MCRKHIYMLDTTSSNIHYQLRHHQWLLFLKTSRPSPFFQHSRLMVPDGLPSSDSHFQRQQEKVRYQFYSRFLWKGETNSCLYIFFVISISTAGQHATGNNHVGSLRKARRLACSFYSNCLSPTDRSLLRTANPFEGGAFSDLRTYYHLLRFYFFFKLWIYVWVCAVPSEARPGRWVPGNRSHKQLARRSHHQYTGDQRPVQ